MTAGERNKTEVEQSPRTLSRIRRSVRRKHEKRFNTIFYMRLTIDNAHSQNRIDPFSNQRLRNDSLAFLPALIPAAETRNAAARAYLRDLRAAEMFAWEMTGGDFLISG